MTRIDDTAANVRGQLSRLMVGVGLLGASSPALAQDFAGTYVQEIEVGTVTKVPIFGRTNTVTYSVVLLTIRPGSEPGTWVQHQHTCNLRMEDDSSAGDPSLSQDFIDNVPDASYPVSFTDNGDGTWAYYADTGVLPVGYDGSLDASLPDNKKDPRIFDSDKDGHPGASLDLKVPLFGDIKVFSVQRGRTFFSGTWTGDGVPEGTLSLPIMESHAFGATIGLFAVNPKVEQVPSKHRHTIYRVADGATCADIL